MKQKKHTICIKNFNFDILCATLIWLINVSDFDKCICVMLNAICKSLYILCSYKFENNKIDHLNQHLYVKTVHNLNFLHVICVRVIDDNNN